MPETLDPRTVLDLFRLDDAVAVVTGGSAGLGAVFAESLAAAGADIVLTARRAERLAAVRERIEAVGRRAICVAADVSDPAAGANVVDEAMTAFGKVDILVNNAGMASAVPASRETAEEFSKVIDTNLSGAYWMAQAAARVMRPGSSIVNISSVLGLTTAGLPQAAYAASKAGLLGLTRDLAQQWTARKGIRVNALVPGFFQTEMTEEYSPEYRESLAARMVTGRAGDPVELAAALLFLVSRAGGYATGTALIVDGGFSIT
ncbi:MAG TPA: SDR family oxidoreductase [Jatrophihabitans sp.]|jgi:NAD(P)-dependent dehydrogenase (short-subunit alcohol dehydrogenase family)